MKDFFRLNSLNKEIILYIFIIISLCVIVSAFTVSLLVEYQVGKRYQVEKEAAIESLSSSLGPLLEIHDYEQIELTLTSSLAYENISYIAVFDEQGDSVRTATENNVLQDDLEINRHDIALNGNRVGSFEIGFSKEYINTQIKTATLALTLSLTGFMIIAGLAFYLLLNRYVIEPIEVFTRKVKEISPDNLSVRMQVTTDDEIGTLAANFNRMAEDLEKSHVALTQARDELERRVEERTRGERRRSEQLRQINEAARRISSILTLNELIPYVVDSLQETFGFYNVNIFLTDDESDNLILKAGAGGYSEDVPTGYMIKKGDGIIGWVARSGEPFVAGDVGKEPRYIYVEQLPDTASELAVPIKIGGEILGVLDIESTEIDAFDEVDLFTVRTLGDQIAIAIENARLYEETREMAVLDERNRLAREIHDTLAQGFTGIVLQLEAAEQAIDQDTNEALGHLDRARELARESLNEARRSVWALRPEKLEQSSLLLTIQQQVEKFEQDTGVSATFNSDRKERKLAVEIENALLRICQESLTNVQRHAEASRVEVTLAFEGNAVILCVRDNGVGFDPETPKEQRFGLISIRERARLLGGTLEIKSEKDKGTQIEVRIPISGG